jgi:hypothetical protein
MNLALTTPQFIGITFAIVAISAWAIIASFKA